MDYAVCDGDDRQDRKEQTMRIIDADTLIRYGKCGTLVYWEDIENAPSIDIVFCKECKHYNGNEEYCSVDHYATESGFCNYGERREP